MSATRILADLTAQGFTLAVTGERLTVAPASRLSSASRALIQAHKAELIAALSRPAPAVAPPLSASDQDAIHEAIEERAAILEFEAGRSRTEAETQATLSMHVYRYRVTDRPQDWLTLIAPGCDLEEARQSLLWQFGADRLIEVHPWTIPHH